ncbi:MAG: endo alpha-1,4 polygalactosaminidase [Nocardioides sp.]|uniref:endo alpha-1,4 polygalactosaminidase n=1 Tax=Nocardioides sp. TaxID=35761 RepID=UPI0039E514C8
MRTATRTPTRALLCALVLALSPVLESAWPVTSAASVASAHAPAEQARVARAKVVRPPVNAAWDYQIGGAFKPAKRVRVVTRDRTATPARGRYNVCYVNAFQTQPDERALWRRHPGLILRKNGTPVVDGAWDERLLDTGTARKRHRLLRIERRWVKGCAKAGFDAVEFDNLDSWQRSKRQLTKRDNVRFARLLVRAAHRHGLAAGQKNTVEVAGARLGFDFAVAEECARWHECAAYSREYHRRVLDVEYTRKGFRRACRNWGPRISVVRRDLAVSARGVDRRC